MESKSLLRRALEHTGIEIESYDRSKANPFIVEGRRMDLKKLLLHLSTQLDGMSAKSQLFLIKACSDHKKRKDIIEEWDTEWDDLEANGEEGSLEGTGILTGPMEGMILNNDISENEGSKSYFVTKNERIVYQISSRVATQGLKPDEAIRISRKVIRQYRPRSPAGVTKEIIDGASFDVLNSYVPARWQQWREENPKLWRKLPTKCPPVVNKIIRNMFPHSSEREYFYAWTYASMVRRAYTYLILCGVGGVGKNRIKILLKAMHGDRNTTDGKRSTFTDKFNSQLMNSTLVWFDELSYNEQMENVMKEVQNDYVSIEKKGVDATSSTKIYPSMVISNNKPRDNFVAFDARKFTPVVLGDKKLGEVLDSALIEEFTNKFNESHEDYDVELVAQTAKFLLAIGKKFYDMDTSLEYKGPMFWALALSSMTRWQKVTIVTLVEHNRASSSQGYDKKEDRFQWSKVERAYNILHKDKTFSFPDYSNVRHFLENFRSPSGKKIIRTELLPGLNIMGDFYIYADRVDINQFSEKELLTTARKEAKGMKYEANREEAKKQEDEDSYYL